MALKSSSLSRQEDLCLQVVLTISQGKIVWDGSRLHIEKGAGRFIECPTFGNLYKGLDTVDKNYLGLKFPYGDLPVKRKLKKITQTGEGEL